MTDEETGIENEFLETVMPYWNTISKMEYNVDTNQMEVYIQ